jgi:Heavy metal associated domain 2
MGLRVSGLDSAPSDPEALRLVHHHPGRIRLRSEALCGAENTAVARVRAALEQIPGVRRAEHRPRTGGLLIEYEPGSIEPDSLILRVAEAARLGPPLDELEARRRRPTDLRWLVQAARELNTAAGEITGFRVDLRTIVPAVLVGAAVASFIAGAGQRVPRWDNLVFWSLSLGARFFREELARAKRPPGDAEEPMP